MDCQHAQYILNRFSSYFFSITEDEGLLLEEGNILIEFDVQGAWLIVNGERLPGAITSGAALLRRLATCVLLKKTAVDAT